VCRMSIIRRNKVPPNTRGTITHLSTSQMSIRPLSSANEKRPGPLPGKTRRRSILSKKNTTLWYQLNNSPSQTVNVFVERLPHKTGTRYWERSIKIVWLPSTTGHRTKPLKLPAGAAATATECRAPRFSLIGILFHDPVRSLFLSSKPLNHPLINGSIRRNTCS